MTEKNKKSKEAKILSPENYIRKKAKNIPVYECWVNANWEESKLVQAVLSRKDSNGKIILCTFLVDLMCLGIKDTYYLYNLSETKYREQIYNISEQMSFDLCNYSLIHNIVFSGLKFAKKFGFNPVKDFTSTTKYMLEEENANIEQIDIECGENGKPLYMRGPFESELKAKQIVEQLENTAGIGNYRFIDDLNNDLYDDLNDFWDVNIDNNDVEFENKYSRLSTKEKLALFKVHMVRIEELNKDEKIDFTDLVEAIIEDYLDQEKADEIYDRYIDKLDIYDVTDTISEEMLPGTNLAEDDALKLKPRFLELYESIISDTGTIKNEVNDLVQKYPDNPGICFLQLTHLRLNDTKKYKIHLNTCIKQFPNYPLIKLLNQINNYVEKTEISNGLSIDSIIETYFPGRKDLHRIEIFHVFMFMFVYATKTKNIELLDALDFLMEESYLSDQELDLLEYFVTMGKFEFILSKLGKE